jgi:general secretion pathway protein E
LTYLNRVATPEINVCTAEDPIEMEVDNFNQVQVIPQIGLNIAECIRSFLRQDPDIIMVGEIRDLETGKMAIPSTLHTNGAIVTIQRFIDLGLPTFLINSSLRMVKKNCPHWKVQVPADNNKWDVLLDGEELFMPESFYQSKWGPQDRRCRNLL